jgi:hypothetical protein
MPDDRTSRSLDAILAIPTRVLRLEASDALRPQTGQTGSCHHAVLSHPDLRANPNARLHVRQDQVTHMHRLSEYQNTV